MGIQRDSPKNSPKPSARKKITLQHLFEQDSPKNKNMGGIQRLSKLYIGSNLPSPSNNGTTCQSPPIPIPIHSEYEETKSAISYCNNFVFTFTDPLESPSQQDLKRLKLIQVMSFIKSTKKQQQQPSWHEHLLSPLISMVSANLFRPLPPPSNTTSSTASDHLILPDDEEFLTTYTPAWPHLQIVYEILFRLVLNFDPKTLRDYINQPFVLNLLSLFQSEDPRERENLKNVFHRIYSRFTFHRSFMRKAMNDVFLHHVFEAERHCGICDLLEIWGSIINGFAVPLKEEHKLLLMRVLLPLHKTKSLHVYHRQLAYCVTQFVQKEPALGGVVVRGILRYWPVTNCHKEVLFVGEIEELVENIEPDQYRMLAMPLCTQITRCLNSSNSQVISLNMKGVNFVHCFSLFFL